MPVQSIPYILLLGVIFGTTLVASRFSVGQFHPLMYISIRLTLAGTAFIIYYLSKGRRFPRDRRLWFHALMLGVFSTALSTATVVSATQYLSSGVISVLISADPALAILIAHFFLPDEHLNWRKALGVCLGLGGVFLIILRGESGLPDISQADPLGYALVLVGMLTSSGMLVYSRHYMRGFSTIDVTSIRILIAAVILMPLAIISGGLDFSRVDQLGILVIIYATLCAFFGLLLEFYLVKRFGATAAAMPAYLVPIVASITGVILLDEAITTGVLMGFFLVFAGLVLINRSYIRRRTDGLSY